MGRGISFSVSMGTSYPKGGEMDYSRYSKASRTEVEENATKGVVGNAKATSMDGGMRGSPYQAGAYVSGQPEGMQWTICTANPVAEI